MKREENRLLFYDGQGSRFAETAAYTSGRVGGVERMHEPLTWGQDRGDGL